MLRQLMSAGVLLASTCAVSPIIATSAAAEAAATAPAYTTDNSTIGDLLDNPETKVVIVKHLPDLVGNPQIEMARGMTLKQIQSYSADSVTDEVLAKIDADLSKIKKK
ncbi:hypothetical protein [Novosphingobium sp. ZW T3_23]|uniref:hypothetical protein n=1 Tax=Novosphingobium sp. ZW T3_23 TaxID=3378084 RepID=UPI00385404F0